MLIGKALYVENPITGECKCVVPSEAWTFIRYGWTYVDKGTYEDYQRKVRSALLETTLLGLSVH